MGAGCIICDAEEHPQAYACKRCKKILDRVELRSDAEGRPRRFDRQARIQALRASWRRGAFYCFYTGVQPIHDPTESRDHRYLSFEHQTPGDESSVVVLARS